MKNKEYKEIFLKSISKVKDVVCEESDFKACFLLKKNGKPYKAIRCVATTELTKSAERIAAGALWPYKDEGYDAYIMIPVPISEEMISYVKENDEMGIIVWDGKSDISL